MLFNVLRSLRFILSLALLESLNKQKLLLTRFCHCLCFSPDDWDTPRRKCKINSENIMHFLFDFPMPSVRMHLCSGLGRASPDWGQLIINELAPLAKWPKNAPLLQLSSLTLGSSCRRSSTRNWSWTCRGSGRVRRVQEVPCCPLWPRIIT